MYKFNFNSLLRTVVYLIVFVFIRMEYLCGDLHLHQILLVNIVSLIIMGKEHQLGILIKWMTI